MKDGERRGVARGRRLTEYECRIRLLEASEVPKVRGLTELVASGEGD